MKVLKYKRGFSLIELILGIAITAVLLGLLVFFMRDTVSVHQKNRTIREVNEQGATIMDKIIQAVYEAESIASPTPNNTNSELELLIDSPGVSPTVFSLNNNVLSVSRGNSNEVPLHNDYVLMNNFSVSNRTQNNGWGTVEVEFTLEYNSNSLLNEFQYEKTWHGSAVIRKYAR